MLWEGKVYFCEGNEGGGCLFVGLYSVYSTVNYSNKILFIGNGKVSKMRLTEGYLFQAFLFRSNLGLV